MESGAGINVQVEIGPLALPYSLPGRRGSRPAVDLEDEERAWKQLQQYESFYDNPSDTPYEPLEGTCRWVTNTVNYGKWILHERGFISITGSPGSGKSCLLSWMGSAGLGAESRTSKSFYEKKPAPLIPYFSAPQQRVGSPVRRLLASLYFNILRADSSPAQRYQRRKEPFSNEVIIQNVVDTAKKRPVFWIIDGLDELLAECEKAGETPCLLPFLQSIMKEASDADASLHICYTKRDYPVITPYDLAGGGNHCHFELRMDDHNRPDIERVLDYIIEDLYGGVELHGRN
ncbi:hypothetical protein N8T08_010008 [Aspergillus melleus]|uniref:Uncharacterized protein n=1 Tax=Aspergillus melleus TaxID=138277 RepID=A0ACC3ASH8_9EURO|nr:hypothetical protein N8T08_010008 [Aspergillus melleus]